MYIKIKIFTCFLGGFLAVFSATAASPPEDTAEALLVQVLSEIQAQNWQDARLRQQALLQTYPNFKPAQALEQIIEQQSGIPAIKPLPLVESDNEFTEHNIQAEITARWQASQSPIAANTFPDAVLRLPEQSESLLLVDVASYRLYLIEQQEGLPRVTASYYAAIGKQGYQKKAEGDLRTPLGIYTIVRHLKDKQLDERYGIGALTLNYPNTWDKYLRKTGHGIWLHGVPRTTYSRPPYSSRGCVTLSNHLFEGLRANVHIKTTPVILTHAITWVSEVEQKAQREAFQQAFLQWKEAWASLNTEHYLTSYHPDFFSGKQKLADWRQHKLAVNAHKNFITIETKNLTVLKYPDEKDLLWVRFQQNYQSSNYNSVTTKEQFWKKHDGAWKIINERTLR